MPRYKVLEKSLVGNEVFEAGVEVEYDGYPSANLEPLCDQGRKKAVELEELNKKRVELMISQNPPAAGMDAASFAKAIAEALTPLVKTIGGKAKAE